MYRMQHVSFSHRRCFNPSEFYDDGGDDGFESSSVDAEDPDVGMGLNTANCGRGAERDMGGFAERGAPYILLRLGGAIMAESGSLELGVLERKLTVDGTFIDGGAIKAAKGSLAS